MTNQKQPKLVVQVEQQNEKAPGEEEVTVAQHKKPQVKVVTSTSNNINNNEENEDNEMPCTPPAQPIISTTQSYSSPVTIMVRAVVPRMERLSWPRFALLSFLVALPTLIYILGFTRLGLGMDCFYYLADRYGDDYASTVGGMTGFWFLLLYVLDADSWHLRFTYGILYQRVCGLLFVLGTTLTVLFMTGDYPYGPICLFAALTPLFLIFTNNVLPERKPTRVYVRSLSGPLFFISVLTGVIWLVWTFLQEENEYNQVTKVVFAQATGCKPNLEEFPECSRAAYEEAIMAYFDPQNETQSQVETDMDLFNSTDNATDNTRFLHTVPNGTHHHNETDEFNHKDDSNLTTTIVQDESQWNPTDVCFDVIQSPPAFLFPVNNQYNYNGTTTTTADKEFCDSDCPRHVYQDCLNAFILWAGPLLVSMVLFFLSFFCTFLHNTKNNNNTEISRGALDPNDADSQQQQQQPSSEENEEQEQQQPKVENNSTTTDMLNFGKLWLFLLFVMWLTASLAGVAAGLTSALLAMTLASFVGSVILAAMTRSKVESKAQAKAFWKSLNEKYGQHLDVARGLFLVTCTPMILIYVVLSVVNQGIRKLGLPCSKPIKTEEARQDFITKRTRRHINAFLSWDRTKVLTYAVYWGVAFMMLQVIVAQFTVLFLSWLIESTSSLNVGTVTAILVGVGMIMFMLPPVPGVPIYLTLGIVILATGRDMFGLSGSMAYAAAISLALKLVACTVQQKLIGENLARYVAVRKLVQINSKLIKAMKLILAQPGMGIDKVRDPIWMAEHPC